MSKTLPVGYEARASGTSSVIEQAFAAGRRAISDLVQLRQSLTPQEKGLIVTAMSQNLITCI